MGTPPIPLPLSPILGLDAYGDAALDACDMAEPPKARFDPDGPESEVKAVTAIASLMRRSVLDIWGQGRYSSHTSLRIGRHGNQPPPAGIKPASWSTGWCRSRTRRSTTRDASGTTTTTRSVRPRCSKPDQSTRTPPRPASPHRSPHIRRLSMVPEPSIDWKKIA